MKVKFQSTCKVNGQEFDDCTPVNPGKCFGNAWLISAGKGNWPSYFIVEANSEMNAIEEFAASKFGHLVLVDETYIEEAKLEGYIGEYVLTSSGYIDLGYNFSIVKCDSFIYNFIPETFSNSI